MSFQPSPGTDTDTRTDERPHPAYYGCGGTLGGALRVNLVVLTVLVGVWALTGSDGLWPLWVALGMAAALAFKAVLRRGVVRSRPKKSRSGTSSADDA